MARPTSGWLEAPTRRCTRTPRSISTAHQADLDLQDQENANFKQARGDPEANIVFCLSEASSKEAVMRTHERAGHATDEVFEIKATA